MPDGLSLHGDLAYGDEVILTPPALAFLADLHRRFDPTRRALLALRSTRPPPTGFAQATRAVREGEWTCAQVPEILRDRRVEITGPVDRKMVINALNSGARVFMADFEDATTPTWRNLLDGQRNLRDAVRKTISLTAGDRSYQLADTVATLFVRPRGWHLSEAHLTVDGQRMSGALFDFGLFFFHNAAEQVARGAGPFFYLPKLESHLEARLWNDVFLHAQHALGLPEGTIKATVLIETLPAAFEMHEILWELRAHSAGLNCGRWDYIFSAIKRRATDAAALMPDRAQLTMDKGFLRAYSEVLIQTCHRRGVHAMGGMAAQIPIKGDETANRAALAKVTADKLREVRAGHDGTWVAHPALVPVAMAVFDAHMPDRNQLGNARDDVTATTAELLEVPDGERTWAGLRANVSIGVQYLEAWLRGQGCVPLHNLMEDAATAEISRAQVWQWLHHEATVDGTPLTRERYQSASRAIVEELGVARYGEAGALFDEMCTAASFPDFLTLEAYERIVTREGRAPV